MDKDLKKLIIESVNKAFESAPEKLIERGVREIYYDICPHCKQEIHEKHEYTQDGGLTWRHSDCGGLIARPETPMEQIADWLRPYVEEAREQRRAAREALGLAPLPSEKPGGTMAAVNIDEENSDGYIGDVRDGIVRGHRTHNVWGEQHNQTGYNQYRWRYDGRNNVVVWTDGILPQNRSDLDVWLEKRGVTPKGHLTLSDFRRR